MVKARMDSAARRRLIVETVTPLFARKGFAGVTTKEMAKAAGVSEALLYRHFPTKAALYEEILQLGCQGDPDLIRLEELPPSTETLILIIYGLVRHIVLGELGDKRVVVTRMRLVLNSMMEDGEYACVHFGDASRRILPIFSSSISAARDAGDLRPCGPDSGNVFWYACHLASFIALGFMTEGGVVPYQGDVEAVVTEAARFILRGLGVRDTMIDAPFDPAALAVLKGEGAAG